MSDGKPDCIELTVNDNIAWHAQQDHDAILQALATSKQGLSAAEAASRLSQYGPNALTPAKKASWLSKLWAQLDNVMMLVLVSAAIVLAALQHFIEFALIVVVVVVNCSIGLLQEGKAEKAAEAIKAMLSSSANVVRDGKRMSVPAEALVPGDIVAIKSGDKVPADLRMLEINNLQILEAMLTGESNPISKNLLAVDESAGLGDRKCMAFSATNVSAGQGLGVVVATGDNAEIGKINTLVSQVENIRTNLSIQMEILGHWIAAIVVLIAVGAFLLAHFRSKETWKHSFESAVAIAVAMIPEGLPALVTIVLALGTRNMARHNAIIKQLPCVETLGSLTVICSDKTGTLTKNEMTVVAIKTSDTMYNVSGVGYAPTGGFASNGQALRPDQLPAVQAVLEGAMLCNDSDLNFDGINTYSPIGAPTEVALITAGLKANLAMEALQRAKPRVASVPFESEHKFMATVHQVGGAEEHSDGTLPRALSGGCIPKRVLYVKGAPDRLMPMCATQYKRDALVQGSGAADLEPFTARMWEQSQEELSSQGLRVLALCRAELTDDENIGSLTPGSLQARKPFLTFVALLAIMDPPREEAIEAIKEAHTAGICVKMITGDHALTGLAIGKMLGIAGNNNVITGPEIDKMTDRVLAEVVNGCNIYARASPENKLRIVKALQAGQGRQGAFDGDDPDDDGPPKLEAEPNSSASKSKASRAKRLDTIEEVEQLVPGGRHICAMTGDGVNDAPALKAADIGVAMGITGTDVTKEAAKMVLADDNFATIVVAVREGRRVWDNLRKLLVFNLPVNFSQGTCIFWAFVLGFKEAPITAMQVLYVNLVTSITLGLMLACEPAEPDVMTRPPRRPGKRLLGKLVLWRCWFVSLLIVILVLGMYGWALSEGKSLARCRAEAFNTLVFCEISYSITTRFLKLSSFHPRVLRGNVWCILSIAVTAIMQIVLTYTPGLSNFFNMGDGMNGIQWARVMVCMVVLYIVVEVEKALVDPVLMPIVRPVMDFIGKLCPRWLRHPSQALPRKFWRRKRTRSAPRVAVQMVDEDGDENDLAATSRDPMFAKRSRAAKVDDAEVEERGLATTSRDPMVVKRTDRQRSVSGMRD